ncbi:hypothetical protein, partial [Pseudomonas helleri]|uniref:hypothetical protein n=1 Tax=Pseudomonas helleri TaxID=1608996 RepID=UPI001E2F701F
MGKLNREITQLESELLATEGIPKLVTEHSLSLRTLETAMGSAAEATEKLKKVWATIIAHIETSATDFKLIKTGQALISFQALNSTHKCNAHPCMHFVRRLPAQALA